MTHRWTTHLLAVAAGVMIGYFIFSQPTSDHSDNLRPQDVEAASIVPVTLPQETRTSVVTTSKEPNEQAQTFQLKATIAEQADQIRQLRQTLAQVQQTQSGTDEANPNLETISMEDFEEKLKGSLRDRFKGYAIEITGEQLDEFHKVFQVEQKRSTWSAEYENYINDFIRTNDPNGLNYVEEVYCNHAMCRMKVQPGDPQQWQQLYSEMTQQSWFNSLTLVEKSDIPGTLIYYIPKPDDF